MNGDLVTVVIPAHNRAHCIDDAIGSVLAQTYKNYEIVVIDDGSTDGTDRAVKKYGSAVRYFHQKNGGPSAARNAGIGWAEGELIAFLDSDDIWLPGKLERQMALMKTDRDTGLIASGKYICDDRWNIVDTFIIDSRFKKNLLKEMFVRNLFTTSTILARKECFDKVGLFDLRFRFGEDWDMWLRIAMEYRIDFIEEPLIKYRINPDSITSEGSLRNMQNWETIISENNRRIKNTKDRIISFRKAMSWYYFNVSYLYQSAGNRAKERSYLARSILSWPFFIYKRYLALLRTFINEGSLSSVHKLIKR